MLVKARPAEDRLAAVLAWLGQSRLALVALVAVGGVLTFGLGVQLFRSGTLHLARDILRQNWRVPVNYARSLTVSPPRLVLDISHMEYQRLAWNREIALQRKRLLDDYRDEVPARIRFEGRTVPVRVRLKGDLSDHWRDPYKWSLRIHTRDDSTILGMRRFSIQHPNTRGYLNEWFVHKLLRHLGLVSIRYDYATVTVNGRDQGVYAVEEHTVREMLEDCGRPNGPIFRAETQLYWRGKTGLVDPLFGAPLDAYETRRIDEDPALTALWETARSRFEAFRDGRLPAHEVFDVEKLATLIAVLDLTGHRHAAALDNILFYYNPQTRLVEPVAGDNNRIIPAVGIEGAAREFWLPTPDDVHVPALFLQWLLADPVLFEHYVAALERISAPETLSGFFREYGAEAEQKLRILYRSFPWYSFEPARATLLQNQAFIRSFLDPSVAVQAHVVAYQPHGHAVTVELTLIHGLPREILGLVRADGTLLPPQAPTRLDPGSPVRPLRHVRVVFDLPRDVEWSDELAAELRLRHRIPGASRTHEDAVARSARVEPELAAAERPWPASDLRFGFLAVDAAARRIAIRPGSWTLDRTLVVPAGLRLTAGEGTEITLGPGAGILSRSPLELRGSRSAPVVVRAAGEPRAGILVLRAGEPSILEHVRFEGLAGSATDGERLPGAVTFLESAVALRDVEFRESAAEASLVVAEGEFRIEDSVFGGARADGLRVLRGAGEVLDTDFADCGRDCIEASGSRLFLRDVRVDGAGGRGVHAVETSVVDASGLSVRRAGIAVAAESESRVDLVGAEVGESRVGLACTGARDGLGPGRIAASSVVIRAAQARFLVEDGARLVVDRRIVSPRRGGGSPRAAN